MSLANQFRRWKSEWQWIGSDEPMQRMSKELNRRKSIELMEPRCLFNADPIWLGGVYIEEDIGNDQHGDMFYVSFRGGAEGTKLTRLIINTDQNAAGYSVGDNIFDTLDAGLGADHSYGFVVERLQAADPNARVSVSVDDASMSLVLTFENFEAGDLLVFSIDVDEIQHYDPAETNRDVINGGLDPITSGVEFQGSKLIAEFEAPHYHSISGNATFVNAYDSVVDPAQLPIPKDNADGKRDRSAGSAFRVQQTPKPISLAGTVYADNNMNLQQDGGEVGLSNVSLELWRKEGASYVSTGHRTTTDSQGNYKFGVELNLQPGTYQVRETQPEGYLSVGAVPGTIPGVGTVGAIVSGNKDILTEITIAKGDQHAVDLDFAEAQPVSISGHVCIALPGFDCFSTAPNSKAPLAGVRVDLLDASGNLVSTTTTAVDGSYRFESLPAGVYSLVEYTPSEYIDGAAKVGSVGGSAIGRVDNPSRISQINLNAGTNGVNYDFCELPPSSLSGHVYEDRNDDGIRQSSEMLIPGAVVRLFDANGIEVAQTITDTNGFYRFAFLKPGTYRLTEQTPANYLDGKDRAGTIAGVSIGQAQANGDQIDSIVLPSGRDGIDYDFGELLPGSIAGRVFADFDGDCVLDAGQDIVLEGILVQLLDGQGNVVREATTDGNGQYRFDGLRPGNYAVREIQPSGYLQGGQIAGSGGGDASSTDLIRQIPVGSGDNLVEYNFCEVPPAELSGWVFVDSNGDCEIQPNEKGIGGVRIDLYDRDGRLVKTTTTNADGSYRFEGLTPGEYVVRESQPAGYFQGGQKAGSHGGDATIADVISRIVAGAGQVLTQYNFCEELPAGLRGVVFVDDDGDCVHDETEMFLAEVKIELLDAQGNVLRTTKTDANGRYIFDNLQPGQYSVRETQPEGYFHGGQTAPEGRALATIDDLLSQIQLASGEQLTELNFCETPPATISGYVFQDGGTLITLDGRAPQTIRPLRDGVRTSDDTPIAGVVLELRTVLGSAFPVANTLPGTYSGQRVTVTTDSNGYFEFRGLRAGSYHIYQQQPKGYIDSLDTPGPMAQFSVNPEDAISVSQQQLLFRLQSNADSNPGTDAILLVDIDAGEHATENNFSEIRVDREPQVPPQDPPKTTYSPPPSPGTVSPPFDRVLPEAPPIPPALYSPPLGGVVTPYSWHLSIVDGGSPRGYRKDRLVSRETIARATTILDVTHWTVAGMKSGKWTIVSTGPEFKTVNTRSVFNLPGATALTGDFNGDGIDELALFLDGEWLLDVNGNGTWDNDDLWAKLGTKQDLAVVGDWDGDGKDDIGIFGPEWEGDRRAIAREPGLPDPENRRRVKPKNLPPMKEEAPDQERVMQRNLKGQGRTDLIDHIFRFGEENHQAIAGDFNGDGISSVGVFKAGRWRIDVDGDGRFSGKDLDTNFGQAGDTAVVGDFDGDGIDEMAIVRGNQVIIDSNHNGQMDASDEIVTLEDGNGQVIVGDFDGDGKDEPALHDSGVTSEVLQAKRPVPGSAR